MGERWERERGGRGERGERGERGRDGREGERERWEREFFLSTAVRLFTTVYQKLLVTKRPTLVNFYEPQRYFCEYFGLCIRGNCFCAVAHFAEVFRYLFLAVLTWSGHPNMENGRSPEENQVSRTSSSDERNYQDTTLNRTTCSRVYLVSGQSSLWQF